MRFIFLNILLCFFLLENTNAQSGGSWRNQQKLAKRAILEGNYAEAAAYYEGVWKQKPKNVKALANAAEYYYLVKNYSKAAETYKALKDNKKYPLAALQYARSLKQSGQYDDANREYVYFQSNYVGKDKQDLQKIVQNELKGCEMALEYQDKVNPKAPKITYLQEINSTAHEFSPIPFDDEVLYFSSTAKGAAALYRTQKQNGKWTKAAAPNNFPTLESSHIANGSFSPDAKRFYFTVCQPFESANPQLGTRCEIYMVKREGNTDWSAPIRLRDYINEQGATTTHPNVVYDDDKEILYFASNRKGSVGGMDLWYTARPLAADDMDFSQPVNLGNLLNTPGDEITPFYNAKDHILYFSSNAQPGFGGYDIFKCKGNLTDWLEPENVLTPLNSSADDFYFTLRKSNSSGFLVSNRLFEQNKNNTTNEDIFEWSNEIKEKIAKGSIVDKSTNAVIPNARISLFDISDEGQKRLLNTKISTDGNFNFVLLPDKNIRIEVEKEGYKTAFTEFETATKDTMSTFKAIFKLEKSKIVKPTTTPTYAEDDAGTPQKPKSNTTNTSKKKEKVNVKPSISDVEDIADATPKKPKKQDDLLSDDELDKLLEDEIKDAKKNSSKKSTTPKKTPNISSSDDDSVVENTPEPKAMPKKTPPTSTTKGGSKRKFVSADDEELITDAPVLGGTYYKVQIMAMKAPDLKHNRFNGVRNLGRLDTEYIVGRDLSRILLGDYTTLKAALKSLETAKQFQQFSGAYIVRYQDGIRIGKI